jgi:hypothetical protein
LLLFPPTLPFPLLSSSLFCRWWNCLKSIHNMEYELMIYNLWGTWHHHTSRPYITFSSLTCYDAFMLQDYDQMMIHMFLRPFLNLSRSSPLLLPLFSFYLSSLLSCLYSSVLLLQVLLLQVLLVHYYYKYYY